MKFSESWLRTWVNPSHTTAELAHWLTMAGIEVEGMEAAAPAFERVVVGQILTVEKHPQADRLNCLQVDIGEAEPLAIVCGASNVVVGMKAPCALVGALLPGGLEIKVARVRGVESRGMMCAAQELGLPSGQQGLLELPGDAPVGQSVRQYLELDDILLTLKLTPNRADCLSIRGVAREVAALTGAILLPQPLSAVRADGEGLNAPQIRLPEDGACGRYCGRTLRLDHPQRPTPDWMVRRLERSGLRAKCLVVDVTNYVMLELGQPLHAFDRTRLKGGLDVRWARSGESLVVLDGQVLELTPDLLVVADEQGPQALAGLMGGLASGVNQDSVEIFLEAAWFAPSALAGRARRLAINSDSAYRFERGIDPQGVREALDRACHLLLEVAGGAAGPVVEVNHPSAFPSPTPVLVRAQRVDRLLGFPIPYPEMENLLRRIGATVQPVEEGWWVTAPSYRVDLEQDVDYVEEIARCHGYEKIPEQIPLIPLSLSVDPETRRSRVKVAQLLHDQGFQEVVTYSFVSAEREALMARAPSNLTLMNPLSSQLSTLRSTLATGLMETLVFNLKRKQENVRIFEWGRCFLREPEGDLPYHQPLRLGGLWYGAQAPQQWSVASESVDFYDIKGVVESLLPEYGVSFVPLQHPALHPGRSASIHWNGVEVGWLGEMHPVARAAWDLPQAPLLFELEWSPLTHQAFPQYQPTPRFQPVRRDVALVMDEAIAGGDVLDALRKNGSAEVVQIDLFDVYRGPGLPDGQKSLAFCVTIQDNERASTENELDHICRALVQVAADQFGARLR